MNHIYRNTTIDIGKTIHELSPISNPLYKDMDEIACGKLFAITFKDIARYNTTTKSWFVYDGTRWIKDTGDVIVEGLSQNFISQLFNYSIEKYDSKNEDTKIFQRDVFKCRTRSRRMNMIKDARSQFPIDTSKLDSNGKLINLLNGTFNLETFELQPHKSADMCSKIADVNYKEGYVSEDFLKFIDEIMCGDKEKIEYIQKIFGYSLSNTTEQEECYMFYGKTTRNGKSTLIEVFSNMLGDYSKNVSPESFAQAKKDSRSASGDIARLEGSRLVHITEPPKKMMMDVALLKRVTGNDTITARQLFESEREFKPTFKLIMNTNYLPVVTDESLFRSERVKIITFDRHFEEEEQDLTLKSRLLSEDNLSGLFNWCVEGYKKYKKDGLIPPESVKVATHQYKDNSDKIKLFFDDWMEESTGAIVEGKEVYQKFREWCKDNGYGEDSKRNFFTDLKNRDLLSPTGTINGVTKRNVIKGYVISDRDIVPDKFHSGNDLPFD